ncbi:MAG: DegT/DnrJ/EryC1/StrS family aminotransferase [Thermoproteota archaeon]
MPKLAINGAEPVRKKPFPRWPIFDEHEAKALNEVLYSGIWGIGGNEVKEFEGKFAAYQHAKYGVAVSNGTVALEVALRALDIKAGDEVIMPAYTFMATPAAALEVNALPVFVDIDPSTYTIDPKTIEEAITEKTKAIMPVHIGGCPADMDSITRIAKNNGLSVIEDACQAWGSEWRGRRVGSLGELGAFSFQSSKNITCGEGGIVTTNDRKLYELSWSYHNCGRLVGGAWYQHDLLGYNFRMTEFQAAILLIQLMRLDEQTRIRNENALYLSRELSRIGGIEPLKRIPEITRHSYHLYIFKYKKEEFDGLTRSKFIEALRAEGIPCSSGYVPLYRERFMLNLAKDELLSRLYGEKVDYGKVKLPVTEKACYEEGVWLFQNMLLGAKEDMDDIVNAIIKIKENTKELVI